MAFKVVSAERMRQIEQAIAESGTALDTLMERAGRAAADRGIALIQHIDDPRVTVLVGKGNNGGDGLVTGLAIANDVPAADVRFYLLAERGDDDPYMAIVKEAHLFYALADADADKRVLRNMVASADLVIDALFGIGVRLPLRDEAAKILRGANRAINERRNAQPDAIAIDPAQPEQIARPAPLFVLALDVPSGLDADTGKLDSATVPADETITFIAAKYGQFTFPGAGAVGKLRIANLEVPATFKALKQEQDCVLDSRTVREMLPQRTADSHKGTYGKTLIVGGSLNYMGAPALSAEAAYRAGAGLVTVATPRPVAATLAAALHEPTWLLLPHDMGVLSKAAVDVLLKEVGAYAAMLLGPGITTEKEAGEFLQELFQQSDTSAAPTQKRRMGFAVAADDNETAPAQDTASENGKAQLPALVIDADALNWLAQQDAWWQKLPEATIITPHPAEMARLAGVGTADVQADRWGIAREKAAAWQVIIVLKGAHTLIASPSGEVCVLPFKTDALATAGTGDVLAGLIAGFVTQGMKPFDAAQAGAYVHGLAGDIAAAGCGNRSVIAGDVIAAVGRALQRIDVS